VKVAGQQLFTGEVLANIQSGVLVVGQDNRVLSANRQARTILELGDEDFVGQDLNRLPPCVGDTLYSVLQTGQPAHAVEQVLPGSRRPLRLHATRFTTSLTGGSDQMVVALVEDLTQTKIQEAQARELADREFFTRLAARLSHELKNALVSVKIYAQLLPERKNDPEFREEFSRTVVNEVNRVDALVNNLTFFSHPLGLVHENLDLAAVLDTTLKTVTNECGRQQKLQVVLFGEKATETPGLPTVTVKRTYQHKPARIAADRIRLIQAFEHVLRNAFQALDQGGRLSISTADAAPTDYSDGQLPPGGAVKIEVLDTGEGIALEKIAHVTEPFVTTRNIGVGLGLTIVKKIVERHSGRLIIDSLLGKGTTVTVLLPVKAQPHPEDDLAQPASANHHDGGAVAPTPTRIHAETPHPVH
jgi:signal transduction histidine kinase